MSAVLAQLKAREEMEDDMEECEFKDEPYYGKKITRQNQEALKQKRNEEKQKQEQKRIQAQESQLIKVLLNSITATPAASQEAADSWEDLDEELPSKHICLICMEDKEDFQPKVVMKCCQHYFHAACLKGCITPDCPNCRGLFLLEGAGACKKNGKK